MDTGSQQTPPEQKPAPSVDELIGQVNSEVYSFQQLGQKRSLLQWFMDLSRARKVLIGVGIGFGLLTVIVFGLMLSGSPKNSPVKSPVGSIDTNGNGIIDENDTVTYADGDTNGDEVINEYDTLEPNSTSEDASASSTQELSWWQKLLGVEKNAQTTTSSSGSADTYSVDDGSGVLGNDEDNSNIADDGQSNDGSPELENENIIVNNSAAATANDTNSSLSLAIASWNVYKFNKADVTTNIKKVLGTVDILGMQEAGPFDSKIISKVACSSCAYEMYPKSGGSPKKIAILWNKNKFTLLEEGYKHASTQDGIKKYIVWLKLRENTSKKVFYVLNTHVPHGTGEGPGFTTSNEAWRKRAIAAYKTHMTNAVALVKKFQQSDLPLFFIGDFAANYRKDDCSNKYFPCYIFSKQLQLKSGWEYTDLSGIPKSTGTISDSTRIPDYVFSWQKSYIQYNSMKIVYGGTGAGWGGSDHKPIALRLTINRQGSSSN